MKKVENTILNYSGTFPNSLAIDASGAGLTDGSEFTAAYINNFVFGISQAVLDYSGVTPNGVAEAAGASQFIEGMQKGAGLLPGLVMEWNLAVDPAAIGFRGLLLSGQGVLRANYPELDTNNYVGDGNNAAVAAAGGAYFRADNSDGSSPNIAGVYLILPESRGYAPRGLDVAASVDPQGASRVLGDNQIDASQRITGKIGQEATGAFGYFHTSGTDGVFAGSAPATYVFPAAGASAISSRTADFDSDTSVSPNAAKTDDVETRMSNRSTKYVVIY